MQKTTNYGLNKPDKTDFYNIEDFNANTEIIDTKLKELESSSATANTGLSSHTKNESNPHGVTKSQVGLSNVPNVATNDQTPTYTEASSNTALVSGEKLSVAMGKIAKAVNSLISHLSDTVGHITSSERTAWNNKLDATATDVNADKLDGYHASDFVSLTNFIGGNMGAKAKYYPSAMEKDCNDIDEFIVLASGGEGYHYPTAGGFWYIITLKYSETERKQVALDYVGNKVQVRYEKSGVWYDWVPLALLSEVLPLTGGTIRGSSATNLQLENTSSTTSCIGFKGSTGHLGFIGIKGSNPVYITTDNTAYNLYHKGNSAPVIIQENAPTDTTALWVW